MWMTIPARYDEVKKNTQKKALFGKVSWPSVQRSIKTATMILPGISIEMKSYSVNFVAYSFIEKRFSHKVHICNISNQVHIGSYCHLCPCDFLPAGEYRFFVQFIQAGQHHLRPLWTVYPV